MKTQADIDRLIEQKIKEAIKANSEKLFNSCLTRDGLRALVEEAK